MRPRKMKINLAYSHLTANLEVPDFQYDARLERRLKRRRIANEVIKQNYHTNATSKNVGNCSYAAMETTENSVHMAEEEVDEDYKYFLDNFVLHIGVECANNVGDSDINLNTSRNSYSDDDSDVQYKIFLENLREDGNSYIFEVFADNQFFHVKYEGQEEERLYDLVNSEVQCYREVDEGYRLLLSSSRIEGDSLVYVPERSVRKEYGGSKSEEKSSMIGQKLQVPNKATEPLNTTQGSNDYHVAKHKRNSEVLNDIVDEDYQLFLDSVSRVGETSLTRQDSVDYHVAKHKSNSEVLSDIVDEDYQLFLNSFSSIGDNLGYKPERGVIEVCELENDQSSTDSEPSVLEPNQNYGNSPFIYSKSYDSSWLADERNHLYSMPFFAFDNSPYRKGLMEDLERPFDQKEYVLLMQQASCQRRKERHREGRSAVIKSCPLPGFNKSNLDLYSDLAKAIDQVKEPYKVLFLLRGFFYWLKHVPQEGAFKPWLDAYCLQILQKM